MFPDLAHLGDASPRPCQVRYFRNTAGAWRSRTEEIMESNDLAWSGQSWRMPLWLWLGLAAMAVGTLPILLDFGVGLVPMRGRLSPAGGAALAVHGPLHA